jgi:hypothetical protein
MALFRELRAAAGCSQAARDVTTKAATIAELGVSVRCSWLDQGVQVLDQRRIVDDQRMPSAAWTADTLWLYFLRRQILLSAKFTDLRLKGGTRQGGGLGDDGSNAAARQRQCVGWRVAATSVRPSFPLGGQGENEKSRISASRGLLFHLTLRYDPQRMENESGVQHHSIPNRQEAVSTHPRSHGLLHFPDTAGCRWTFSILHGAGARRRPNTEVAAMHRNNPP